MKAFTYIEYGKFAMMEKAKPQIISKGDAIVRVTLGSICTSDLHIKHGSVPRAVPGITVGHEMVGIVEEVGQDVKNVKNTYVFILNMEEQMLYWKLPVEKIHLSLHGKVHDQMESLP